MDKINLEEILLKNIKKIYMEFMPIEDFCNRDRIIAINAMKEACQEILKLAAENAEIDVVEHEEWDRNKLPGTKDFAILPIYGVDEDSILKTINQIE